MFGGKELQQAKTKGEFNPIPYSAAVKRKPKEGKIFWITPVTWVDAPIALKRVEFLSVAAIDVILPPVLPAGYSMQWHDSWVDLVKLIYTPERVAEMSFDELDNVVKDIYTLEEVTGKTVEWFNIWGDRYDYCEYSSSFDDSWTDLRHVIKQSFTSLFEATNPHLVSDSKGIGNRVFAPTMKDALLKMFDDIPPEYVATIANKLERFKQEVK